MIPPPSPLWISFRRAEPPQGASARRERSIPTTGTAAERARKIRRPSAARVPDRGRASAEGRPKAGPGQVVGVRSRLTRIVGHPRCSPTRRHRPRPNGYEIHGHDKQRHRRHPKRDPGP